MDRKGMSELISNSLLITVVVIGVVVMGVLVLNLVNIAGDSTKIKECEIANIGNDAEYNNCIMKAFGETRGKQILGLTNGEGTWEDYVVAPTGYSVIDPNDIDEEMCYLEISLGEKSISSCNTVVSNGLVAHYCFDGNALDSSGNGNDGVEMGGRLIYESDGSNNYVKFDGIDDYIEVPYKPILNSDQFSISYWIRPPGDILSDPYANQFTVVRLANNSKGYIFGLALSNYIRGYNLIDAGINANTNVDGGYYTDKNWHNVVFVRGSSNIIYVDGIKKYEFARSNNDFSDSTTNLYIGGIINDYGNVGGNLKGDMDDLLFYNRSLNISEIAQIYGGSTNDSFEKTEFSFISAEPLYGDYSKRINLFDKYPNTDYKITTFDSSINDIGSYSVTSSRVVYNDIKSSINLGKIYLNEGKLSFYLNNDPEIKSFSIKDISNNDEDRFVLDDINCFRTCGNENELITFGEEKCCTGLLPEMVSDSSAVCGTCGDLVCEYDEKYSCSDCLSENDDKYYLSFYDEVILNNNSDNDCFVYEFPNSSSNSIFLLNDSLQGLIINDTIFNQDNWWWQIDVNISESTYNGWAMDNCLMRK